MRITTARCQHGRPSPAPWDRPAGANLICYNLACYSLVFYNLVCYLPPKLRRWSVAPGRELGRTLQLHLAQGLGGA